MAKKDAEITVGADATPVERAAAAAKNAWKNVGPEIASQFGSAARQIVGDLAQVALAQGKVNFASQHESVRQFEASSARMAVSMGRDLESVRTNLERTGAAIGKRPGEVASWASEVGKLTYNFGGAAEALQGMAALAATTGRDVDEYRGLATTLANVGGVAGDSSHALAGLKAQADALGNKGGIAAFADQIQALDGVMSHFAIKGEKDLLKVTAAAAALGKGLSPQAAGRVQQQIFGTIAADPARWERFVGHKVTDEHGQIANPEQLLKEIRSAAIRRHGGLNEARRVAMLGGNFGPEAGAALFAKDFEKNLTSAEQGGEAASATDKSLKALQAKLGELMGTDAGKRLKNAAKLDVTSRKELGSQTTIGRAADAVQGFAAENPITSTVGATAATGIIGAGLKVATGAIGGAAALIPAGAAIGYYGGKALDEKYGDRLVGTQEALAGADASTLTMRSARDLARVARATGALKSKPGAWSGNTNDPANAFGPHGAQPTVARIDQREMSDAIQAGFKGVRLMIVNATGGPVEVVDQNGASAEKQGG